MLSKFTTYSWCFFVLIPLFAEPCLSQSSNQKISLDKYRLLFRGAMTRTSPVSILKLDNNLEILLACREGKTAEQLNASGIICLASQLRLLVDWKLLEQKQQIYKPAIPIIGEKKNGGLRISSFEQSSFLQKFYKNELPFSQRNIKIVKDI